MSLPVKEKMVLFDNSVLPFRFPVETTLAPAGWTFQGYAFHTSAPGTPLVPLTVTWDAAGKVGTAIYDPADVATALDGKKSRSLAFVILGKPGTSYAVPFYTGTAELKAGGPAWTP